MTGQAIEQFELDGDTVGTGLLMPSPTQQLLMDAMQTYPDGLLLDDDDIQKRLVVNGKQVYLVKREQRRYRMRNQGPDGKCNGSSNTSGQEQVREGQGMPHVALSDSYLYSLINGGRNNGSALIESYQTLPESGIAPMQLEVNGKQVTLPANFYNRSQLPSDVLRVADQQAKRFRGHEFYKVPMDSFERYCRAIASAIARDQPVVFAWHVGSNSMKLVNGYVKVGRGPGNHSNLLHSAKWVGGRTLVHPDDQNSWGPCTSPLYGVVSKTGWGDGGFGLFTMEDVYACARNHCTYVIASSKADPQDPAFR